MEQNTTTATVQSSAESKYAGFWVRFVAALIDGTLIGVSSGIISSVLGLNTYGNDPESVSLSFLLGWGYAALMESSSKQATFGKQAMRLKVTDENGNKLSFGHATGRHFAKIVSGLTLFIGFLMVGWTQKKQGLHDIIAKTLVVKK